MVSKNQQILFLCRKYYYTQKLSRVRFHSVEAIGRRCKVTWSGPEWENWEAAQLMQPDLIIVYRPYDIPGLSGTDIPVCGLYDELNTDDNPIEKTIQEITDNKIDFVVSHQAQQMTDPALQKLPCKIVHIPYCAEKTIFQDYQLEKKIDVLLVGNLGGRRYPFRARLFDILKKMQQSHPQYTCAVYPYPGYRLPDAYTDREAIKFSQWINAAKITLTGSGIHHLKYAKYVEIPMSRSLLMADMPGEDQEFLKQFMVTLNREWSDEEIIDKIVYYLEHEEERQLLTDTGYKMTRAHYTQDRYAERFMKELELFLQETSGRKVW